MRQEQASRLKRPIYLMPDFIQSALLKHGLLEAYQNRPAYQQNDYIGWITRAKLQATREKRLQQMLDGLATGDRYMHIRQREVQSKTPRWKRVVGEVRGITSGLPLDDERAVSHAQEP